MKRSLLMLAMLFAAFSARASQTAGAVEPTTAPFGSWRSPITAQMLVEKSARFGDMSLDGDTLYWVETRPQEQGRYVIVRRTADGQIEDVLPPPFSARTTVHEYGGGALLASAGIVYFTNYTDQRLWRLTPGQPTPLTAESKLRFADFVHDPSHNRLISVCEDHTRGDHEPANRIVAVDLATGKVSPLIEGADFYSTPRLSPDGRQLAWVSWNHPNMPWDDTKLSVAPIANDGTLGKPRLVAGGAEESVLQPSWSPGGTLYFVSDRTNWWNLYADRDGRAKAILPMDAEFGVPQWVFGASTYGFLPDGHILASYNRGGEWRPALIDPQSGQHNDLKLSYSVISSLEVGRNRSYLTASSPTEPETLLEIDPASGKTTVIRRSTPIIADLQNTSIPQAIEFPTEGGKTAHAYYYPPTNRDFRGPTGEAPPLVVMIHGGPTGATAAQFRLSIQYWTSRGFAVCDVNYGGSTGYGREYRNRLRDAWGVVDVADANNAALYLTKQGKADRNKLIIRGGSAGGYTTLACLAFGDVFRCGASLFGISDLALLVKDTHKFESRYLDRIVGLYPEQEARYRERSPIHHLEKFTEPIILLQGLEDKIVPPNQAEIILESLKKRGIPVAYVPFAGEQHGFRKAENIIRAHEAELYFYSRVLGFPLAEAIDPVEIHNLPPH
jgi:dipeptidyl aminopeptidase/acylaminoacyl peptidase